MYSVSTYETIEGFYIDHDVTTFKELQGGFMVEGIMGSDTVVDILPANELGVKLSSETVHALLVTS